MRPGSCVCERVSTFRESRTGRSLMVQATGRAIYAGLRAQQRSRQGFLRRLLSHSTALFLCRCRVREGKRVLIRKWLRISCRRADGGVVSHMPASRAVRLVPSTWHFRRAPGDGASCAIPAAKPAEPYATTPRPLQLMSHLQRPARVRTIWLHDTLACRIQLV